MSLFAVATVFNMNIAEQNDAGDVSLDAIAVMAQAQDESAWDSFTSSVKDWYNSKIYDCKNIRCIIGDYVPGYGYVYGNKTTCTGGGSVAHCTSCWSFCS